MKILGTATLALALFGGATISFTACSEDPVKDTGGGSSTATESFAATSLTRWFDQLYVTVRTESLNPPQASRVYGVTSVAAYEALVNGSETRRSLGGQLNGLAALPTPPAGKRIHWPAAMNAAVANVATHLFAGRQAAIDAVAALETTMHDEFAGVVSASVLTESETYGDAVATAIKAWVDTDGFATRNATPYVVPTGTPDLWVPTPPGFAANPAEPFWGNVRPMVLLYGAEVPVLPPPAYSEVPGTTFHTEASEVQSYVDATMTQDEKDIANFWADNPGATGTPPGHWVKTVNQLAAQKTYDLAKTAEAMARTGIAVNDAFIACWEMKYVYCLCRPVTYIQSATALNDPTWTSYIGTPAFPEYPSGHSTQSGAAAEVLTAQLGTVAYNDDTHAADNPVRAARAFTSIWQAANEAAISRLYGGIHYRAAIERGVEQGRAIGNLINSRVNFSK